MTAKRALLALRVGLRQRGREGFLLTQHLPLQRALRALGHAGLTSRRAYGARIVARGKQSRMNAISRVDGPELSGVGEGVRHRM